MSIIEIVAQSFKRFNNDRCWTASIVISYFTLLCCVPLLALFFYGSAKILGTTEPALRSLNLFTDAFFARLDPSFFTSLQGLGGSFTKTGLFALVGSFIAGSFLFSSLIGTINQIFRANYHRSFFYNRLMEYILMFISGVILFLSLGITAAWAALQRAAQESDVVKTYVNPKAVSLIDNFFIQYLIPYALSFLVFYVLYKFIPEVKVHTRAAALAAGIGALLFEVFKRGFAFYVAHFSAVGIVLSQVLRGTLTSIIFFLLWISTSLVILLWAAELAAVVNEHLESRAPAPLAASPGGRP